MKIADRLPTYLPTAMNQTIISNSFLQCIGRIQWQNLNFFDARHVRTTREMFEAVCKHIEFATNNGNIR